jgi:hypothetical protein
MRRVSFLVLLTVSLAALGQAGDMARSGSWGIQSAIGVSSATGPGAATIGVKFFVSREVAIRVEAGVTSISPPGGSTATGYAVGAGFEYHFAPVGGVSPYLGVQGGYGGSSVSGGGNTPSVFGARAVWGGEYFFSSNFSWAGEIGFGFSSYKPASGSSTNTFGTTGTAAFILSWYMN